MLSSFWWESCLLGEGGWILFYWEGLWFAKRVYLELSSIPAQIPSSVQLWLPVLYHTLGHILQFSPDHSLTGAGLWTFGILRVPDRTWLIPGRWSVNVSSFIQCGPSSLHIYWASVCAPLTPNCTSAPRCHSEQSGGGDSLLEEAEQTNNCTYKYQRQTVTHPMKSPKSQESTYRGTWPVFPRMGSEGQGGIQGC